MLPAHDKATVQYLARYAEPESKAATQISLGPYGACVVIPAYREDWSDVARALRRIEDEFLLILVVNAPQHDAQTLTLLADARGQGTRVDRMENVEFVRTPLPFDILLVDRCSAGRVVPAQQGVGLARKTGADIALSLMASDSVRSGLIYSSDADAELPAGYFRHDPPPAGTAAVLFPFVHRAEAAGRDPALLYEISMLYYVAGLKHAGSPYAFPSLGSCLAVSMYHYARVRGFPRRNAAEDFYLLNKLAKSGAILQLASPCIEIAGRESSRVPFGTGPGIKRISQLADPVREFRFYHPAIFELLGQLLDLLGDAWKDPHISRRADCPPELASWAREQDIETVIQRLRRGCRQESTFRKAMNDWFDGYRTLRFVHTMRDEFLPGVPLESLFDAPFVELAPVSTGDLPALRLELARRVF